MQNLAQGLFRAGTHRLEWNASALPAGLYLCRINSQNEQDVEKVVLLK